MRLLSSIPGINENIFNVTFILQSIVNGVTNGLTYGAMALAVVVIYRTTGHMNMAQGEMATFSVFVIAALMSALGWAVWPAIIAVVVGSALLGGATERVLIRSLDRRQPSAVLVVGLALYLIFNAVTSTIWGTSVTAPPTPFPSGFQDRWLIMKGTPDLIITHAAALTWVTVAAVFVALHLLLHHTRLGLAYRAVASNRESSLLVGIPVGKMLMLGWALAAAVGCIVGVIVAQLTGALTFNLMGPVLIYGFAAACLGGFDSIKGAIVGGLIVGLTEAILPNLFTFIGPELGLVAAFVVIVTVLLVSPQGLFGTRRMERV